jgi:hypothetical protein
MFSFIQGPKKGVIGFLTLLKMGFILKVRFILKNNLFCSTSSKHARFGKTPSLPEKKNTYSYGIEFS